MSSRYLFLNDYSENAHPSILAGLTRDSSSQELGYGGDTSSREAAEMLKSKCGMSDAEVHFVSGGTQANLVVCSAFLKPYESIVAAEIGHICVHEAGAIEATGHKVHHLPHEDGKLRAESIRSLVSAHTSEHMVKPRMVFISQATEVGTVYSKRELTELSSLCRELDLILYMDGARLGAALAGGSEDLSLADIAQLVDVFYFGGTKNGALFGEAIVVCRHGLGADFRYHLKQNGALLAKSRALGAQFRELFRNDLYMELSRVSVEKARYLANGIRTAGFAFAYPVASNQIFPILPNALIEKLEPKFGFYVWAKLNERESVIRLVTSWATHDKAIDEFLSRLAS